MNDEFGPNFVTLTDDEGNDVELEYVDALEVALFGVKLTVYLYLQPNRRRVHFSKGKLHE